MDIIVISLKIHLLSSVYSWKISELVYLSHTILYPSAIKNDSRSIWELLIHKPNKSCNLFTNIYKKTWQVFLFVLWILIFFYILLFSVQEYFFYILLFLVQEYFLYFVVFSTRKKAEDESCEHQSKERCVYLYVLHKLK